MNGLFRVDCAQTEFVWKLVDLHGRRTDRRNSAFMGGSCRINLHTIHLLELMKLMFHLPLLSRREGVASHLSSIGG